MVKYFLEDGKTPMPENMGKGLKVSVDYSKGGMNYFNYKIEPRGYYLYVTRVERSKSNGCIMESHMMFTGGLKRFLLEVKRKSDKAQAQAERMALDVMDEVMTTVMAKCPSSAGI